MVATQVIYLIPLAQGNFLAGEGVVFGDRFYGCGRRFNPGTFIVDVVGGFDLEGVAMSGIADVGGLR